MTLTDPNVFRTVDPTASVRAALGPKPEVPVLPEVDWDSLDQQFGARVEAARAAQQAEYQAKKAAAAEADWYANQPDEPAAPKEADVDVISEFQQRLAAYPGIDPDAALEAMIAGVDDPKVWEDLWELSKEETRTRVQSERDAQETPKDWGDQLPGVKGITRALTAGIMAPYESITALGRTALPEALADIGLPTFASAKEYDPQVQGEFRTKPLLDQVWTAMGSTIAGQSVAALLRGEDVDLGDGWVPSADYEDPGSIPAKVAERNNRMAAYIPRPGDYAVGKREDGSWAVYGPGKDNVNFTPSTAVPGDNIASNLANTALGKPTAGTGSRNVVRVFTNEEEAQAYAKAPKPYTPVGDALTVSVVGMKYGSEYQRLASGVADAFAAILADPTNLVPSGAASKAGKATKAAGQAMRSASTEVKASTLAEDVADLLRRAQESQESAAAWRSGLSDPSPAPGPASPLSAAPRRPMPTAEPVSPTPLSPVEVWKQEAAETLARFGQTTQDASDSRVLRTELEAVYQFLTDVETRAYKDIAKEKAELEGRIAGLSDEWAKDSQDIGRRDADAETAEAARIADSGQQNAAWRAGKTAEDAEVIRQRVLAEEALAAAKQDELDALKALPVPEDEAEAATHAAKIAQVEQEVAEATTLRMPVTDTVGAFDEQLSTLKERLARLDDPEEVTRRVMDTWDAEGPQRTWLHALLTDDEAQAATKVAPEGEAGTAVEGTASAKADEPLLPSVGNQYVDNAARTRFDKVLRLAERLEQEADNLMAKAKASTDEFIAANPTYIRDAIAGRKASDEYAGLTDEQVLEQLVSTPEGLTNLMDDVLGVVRSPDGKINLDINSFFQAFMGKKVDKVFETLARADDVGKLTRAFRGALPTKMTTQIQAAKTVDDVRSVFVHWLADGELIRHNAAMREIRRWSRFLPDGTAKQDFDDAFLDKVDPRRVIPRMRLYGNEKVKAGTPWSVRKNADDVDGVVNLFLDFVDFTLDRHWFKRKFSKAEVSELENRYLTRIINAKGGPERKTAWLDFLTEVQTTLLAKAKDANGKTVLTKDDVDAVEKVFKQHVSKVQGAAGWNPAERAAADWQKDTLAAHGLMKDANVGMMSSDYNEWIWAPNPKKIRRLVRDITKIKKNGAEGSYFTRLLDAGIDNFWRTAVLILRPAFTMRNLLDAQVRLYLGGYQNIFTNPFSTLGAMHHAATVPKSRLGKALFKMSKPLEHFDKIPVRPDGHPWLDPQNLPDDNMIEEFEQGYFQILDWDQAAMDWGTPAMQEAKNLKFSGYVEVQHSSDQAMYWRGVANTIGKAFADPIFRAMTDITMSARGAGRGRIPPDLASHAKTLGIDDLSKASLQAQQDVLVHACLHGDGVYQEAWDRVGALLAKRNNSDTSGLYNPAFVREMIFGSPDTTAFSYLSRLQRYTRYDPDILDNLWSGRYDALSTQMSATPGARAQAANARVKARNEELQDLLRSKFGSDESYYGEAGSVKSINAPLWEEGPSPGLMAGPHKRLVEGFFNTDMYWQKQYQIPFYKERLWEVIADFIPAMSKSEADKVMAAAKKNFKGIGTPRGYRSRIHAKLEKAYREVQPGTGMTLDEAMVAADKVATKEAQEMFYTATQRNQTAYALRFLIPFGQAWANTLKVWGTLAAEAPLRLNQPIRAYRGATSSGSAEAMAAFHDDPEYNPNRALVSQDKNTGEMVYEVPLMGPVISNIVNGTTAPFRKGGHVPGVQATSTLNSLNLLFQGGFFPGVSPLVQTGAYALSGTKAWSKVPNVLGLKDQALPYRDPDAAPSNNLEAAFNAFTPTVIKALTAPFSSSWNADTAKYASEAIGALYSSDPAAYTNPDGAINRDKLEADAQRVAQHMVFAQGIVKINYPGTVKAKALTKTEKGMFTQDALAREFYTEVQAYGGDRGMALKHLTDKYGRESLLALVSSREGAIRPTTEGWKWFQEHKDDVTAANAQDVLPYFFVKDGVFSKEYNLYLKNYDKNQRLKPQEMITQAENLMKAMEIDQLNVRHARGEIPDDAYEMAKDRIDIQFSARGVNDMTPAARTEKINSMRLALTQSPDLAKTSGGQKIQEWLDIRDEALLYIQDRELTSNTASPDPFAAKSAFDIRMWLYETGSEMAKESEEFKHAWDSVFKYEVAY